MLYLYWEQPCCTCTGSSLTVLYWANPHCTFTGSSLAVPVLGVAWLYLYWAQPCCTGSVPVLVVALPYLYWAQPCCTCTGNSLAVPVLGAALLHLYWEQPCCICTGLAVPLLGAALLYLYWAQPGPNVLGRNPHNPAAGHATWPPGQAAHALACKVKKIREITKTKFSAKEKPISPPVVGVPELGLNVKKSAK